MDCCNKCENITHNQDGEEYADCLDENCKCHSSPTQSVEEKCNHWNCNGCNKCGGWANNPDSEKACTNNNCKCHKEYDCKIKCGNECGFEKPYGFVPEAGCKIHDVFFI